MCLNHQVFFWSINTACLSCSDVAHSRGKIQLENVKLQLTDILEHLRNLK